MSLPSVSFSRGVALALVIPWLLALAAVVFGVFAWSRSPNGSANGRPLPVAGSEELKSLRLALTTSSAENQALRKELDRLQESLRASGGDAQQLLGTSGGGLQAPDDLKRELADRLQELLAKAASGDERSQAEAARAIFDLLRGGSAAFSALRDVYLKTADAKGRNLLLASMVFSGAPQARDFVFDQVQTEKDPEIRRALTTQAAKYATDWQTAGNLKANFIDTLSSSDDPATRAAAARGLLYAPGGDAGTALSRAASDPSEEVRLAAIDTLASRPGSFDAVQKIAANDPSPRVREFAQCRLLVAKEIH